MRPPISACVIARDEEANLERCLASIAWVDEICVVLDSRSRDASEEIARRLASRVEVHAYDGDIEQKSRCVERASHDWILIVDPDERMPPDLSCSLERALADVADDVAGFELNRLTWHLGRWIRHGDFQPDWKLRVFRRSLARWTGTNPHGRVVVEGRVRRLPGHLEHFSYRNLADQIDRIQFFSEQSARAMASRGRAVQLRHLVARPPARFLRAFVLRRGFLDGVPGFVIATATAFHVFLKYAKLWELQQRTDERGRETETTGGD